MNEPIKKGNALPPPLSLYRAALFFLVDVKQSYYIII